MQIRDNYKIVIDGYNLIFQCGLEGRRRDSLALDQARHRLITTLDKCLGAKKKQTAIVFDAEHLPIKEDHSFHDFDGLTVIYALDYEDADSLIEEMIRTHSHPKQLLIVSSDHRLHQAALRRKATAIDSDVWFDEIESQLVPQTEGEAEQSSSAKQIPPGLEEVDWASEFGLDEEN